MDDHSIGDGQKELPRHRIPSKSVDRVKQDVVFWALRSGRWHPGSVACDLRIDENNGVTLGGGLDDPRGLFLARLAGEWQYLVRLGNSVTLSGLAAARAASQFAVAEHFVLDGDLAWIGAMAGEAFPPVARLREIWARLAPYWSGAPAVLSERDAACIMALWPLLGSAESIMETGGDIRLRRDRQSDLNGYGCSHRPRPWAITFASSTASSVSERGYEAADRARLRLTAGMLQAGNHEAVLAEADAVRAAIGRSFGVPRGGAVVLAASGTDSELLALALAHLADADRPLTTILLAPEETGSGVPMAATGRHFAIDTANGHDVSRAAPISGFRADTILVSIPLRDTAGQVRPLHEVETEIDEAVTSAVSAGRRVILHALDLSKTGLLAPSLGLLRAMRVQLGTQLDIVVDACQMRVAPARIADYLALDAVVQVTGSKFLTGPPFSGGALLPPAVAGRLQSGVLPAGLDAYFSQGDWPRDVPAAAGLPAGANYGLLLRWHAALAEYRAFAAVADTRKAAVIDRFRATIERAIERHNIFVLLESPPLQRDGESWDRSRTVFAFAVKAPDRSGRLLDPAAMRQLYQWLNADCAALFEDASARKLAARICHIGQPVALLDGAGDQIGWLRVSAGARLISGEPSHRGLAVERRLDREMADLTTVFDKIALLHAHWALLDAANPMPQYANR